MKAVVEFDFNGNESDIHYWISIENMEPNIINNTRLNNFKLIRIDCPDQVLKDELK